MLESNSGQVGMEELREGSCTEVLGEGSCSEVFGEGARKDAMTITFRTRVRKRSSQYLFWL